MGAEVGSAARRGPRPGGATADDQRVPRPERGGRRAQAGVQGGRWGRDLAAGDLLGLLAPAAPGRLEAFPVSTLVSNVRNNGPELVEPLPLEGEA